MTTRKLFSAHDRVTIPATHLPGFRTNIAIDQGVEGNLLIRTWGGIGDQICAEPTLRYALKSFKGCNISLASSEPELFSHLEFHEVFDLRKVRPIWDNYLRFETISSPDETNLVWQFMCHMLVNCVDYPSLCAFRAQLPVADREIKLVPSVADFQKTHEVGADNARVCIHPGKHWQSKTFPKEFWNAVINALIARNIQPVLIGGHADDNRSTVDVDPYGCLDLRGKLSIMESVALLQTANVLLTNDSAPLHMAASGDAWIGFVATCKHPDMITHWRNGQWSWRMKNHGKGGIWDVLDHCPNKAETLEAENVGAELLTSWLPDPVAFANWALDKSKESDHG